MTTRNETDPMVLDVTPSNINSYPSCVRTESVQVWLVVSVVVSQVSVRFLGVLLLIQSCQRVSVSEDEV